MPTLMLVLGLIGWIVSLIAGAWYLLTFREIHNELRLIRRYLQSLHDRQEQHR